MCSEEHAAGAVEMCICSQECEAAGISMHVCASHLIGLPRQ